MNTKTVFSIIALIVVVAGILVGIGKLDQTVLAGVIATIVGWLAPSPLKDNKDE